MWSVFTLAVLIYQFTHAFFPGTNFWSIHHTQTRFMETQLLVFHFLIVHDHVALVFMCVHSLLSRVLANSSDTNGSPYHDAKISITTSLDLPPSSLLFHLSRCHDTFQFPISHDETQLNWKKRTCQLRTRQKDEIRKLVTRELEKKAKRYDTRSSRWK